jgi:hypothetical protein
MVLFGFRFVVVVRTNGFSLADLLGLAFAQWRKDGQDSAALQQVCALGRGEGEVHGSFFLSILSPHFLQRAHFLLITLVPYEHFGHMAPW